MSLAELVPPVLKTGIVAMAFADGLSADPRGLVCLAALPGLIVLAVAALRCAGSRPPPG